MFLGKQEAAIPYYQHHTWQCLHSCSFSVQTSKKLAIRVQVACCQTDDAGTTGQRESMGEEQQGEEIGNMSK